MPTHTFTPDPSQQRVIDASAGCHLVLASPGCGKTQILAERIRRALSQGVAAQDMLCLTFTNRAARAMAERVRDGLPDSAATEDLYIGNVHRFCAKFLYDNNIVSAAAAVIDDDDRLNIIAQLLNDDEHLAAADRRRRQSYNAVAQFSTYMHQLSKGYAKALRTHPECVAPADVEVVRTLCAAHGKRFCAEAMQDIYRHADFYQQNAATGQYAPQRYDAIVATLTKMDAARRYDDYKQQHRLLDFEDLLNITHDALTTDTGHTYPRYRWVQVDEVQDLSPLQLAIIDLLCAPDAHIVYLGDEQQAIFSFMGAKLQTLDTLRQRCAGHVHHLTLNHRSPAYLLRLFNAYAMQTLGVPPQLLPAPAPTAGDSGAAAAPDDALTLLRSDNSEAEVGDVAAHVARLHSQSPTETTVVEVQSNAEAETVSAALSRLGVPHFKVSGTDLFATPPLRLLLAHLGVLASEHNFLAWARLLRGLRVFESHKAARGFAGWLAERAILPSDLLCYDDGDTYVQRFLRTCGDAEVVVFDTETTGLDVCQDDIIQIAAVRMRGQEVVAGSAFQVFLTTEREIPARLGDIDNPIIEERRHHELLAPAEALRRFLDYAAGRPLIGHNATFDYQILRHNLRRHLPGTVLEHAHPVCLDTLKMARLLAPNLCRHRLKDLLEELHLAGENSHLADADVAATCQLVAWCLRRGAEVVPEQQRALALDKVRTAAEKLRRTYRADYRRALAALHEPPADDAKAPAQPALVAELLRFYRDKRAAEAIPEVDHIGIVADYMERELLGPECGTTLAQQLAAAIMPISTLKEADLVGSEAMPFRVYVSTVHKAKGLEFDNVVVLNVVDDRFPSYFARNDERATAESARVLYVAMSRARRRLCLAVCKETRTARGATFPCKPSRFLNAILPMLHKRG